MKNSQRGSITTIGIIIALLIIGAGGYYYHFKSNNTTVDTVSLMSGVDTSNWKIYRNSDFNFEFKYPNEFKIEEHAGSDLLLINVKTDWPMKSTIPGISDQNVQISVALNKSLKPASESLSDICDKYKKAEKKEGTLLECGEVSINGLLFAKISQDLSKGLGSGIGITLEATKSPYALMVITVIPDDKDQEDHLMVIDTIFSSLKLNTY
jgi:hypothetical protein